MGGFFWEDNFGGFFVYVGIDLFVKILSKWREKKFLSLEVRRKLIKKLSILVVLNIFFIFQC